MRGIKSDSFGVLSRIHVLGPKSFLLSFLSISLLDFSEIILDDRHYYNECLKVSGIFKEIILRMR